MARIISLGVCVIVLASLFVWSKPVTAGLSEWSPVTIPSRTDNILGPPGVDIRDLAIGSDALTIYAAPGDSISDHIIYKSIDGGLKWTTVETPIRVDLVAIAPDDNNLVAIANNQTPEIYFCSSITPPWQSLGTVKENPGGSPPAVIYDLTISLLRIDAHYIGVAGKEAGDIANLWYFNLGAFSPAWHETRFLAGFSPDSATVSLVFSPYFESDTVALAITVNTSTKDVKLQIINISSSVWNTAASFAGYPCTIMSDPTFTGVSSAALAFSPDYMGNDPDYRQVFIGLTVAGGITASNTSGIYRYDDTVKKALLLDKKIYSITYDGYHLAAGSANTNTVYYSTNAGAITPVIRTSDITKCPGGVNHIIVACMGNNIIAGTSGSESAFTLSEDGGNTFNDISLIDTDISTANDVAVNSDGSIIYLLSENSTNASLWYFDSAIWRRVFSQKNTSDFRVHIAPSNENIVYLTEKNGTAFYYNSNAGMAPWHIRVCSITIQDLTVTTSQVVYVINNLGSVIRTTDNGLNWYTTSSTDLTTGATIISVGASILFAGSTNGYVSYTFDGGTTWTKIPQPIEFGAGSVQIAPDDNFSSNRIIYAASDQEGGNIMKWIIGTSTSWTDIFDGSIEKGIYGLVVNNDVLYALEYNNVSKVSTLWRHLSPTNATVDSTEWTFRAADTGVMLNSAPQALKESYNTLWAINTDTTIGSDKLYIYTDVIVDVEINLLLPPDGYHVNVNVINFTAYDVSFSWERPSIATGYQLFISQDISFKSNVYVISVNSTDDIIGVIVGPHQAGAQQIDFEPDSRYYWKVRVSIPSYSPYSEIRYFIIDRLGSAAFETIKLYRTNQPLDPNPALSWSPLSGITEYEFRLSDDWEMKSLLVDTFVESTTYKVEIPLEYGGTYFWQVRATKPRLSNWSGLATFNVINEPEETTGLIIETAPPESIALTVTAPPETKYSLVEQIINISQPYGPVLIFILIILLGAIAILIFRGKPFKFLTMPLWKERPHRPPPTTKISDIERVRPSPTLPPTAVIPEAPKEAEKVEPHPSLLEKDKEAATVIFAAKSFMWMAAQPETPDAAQAALKEKERRSLGKKLAAKIRDVTRKENLYLKYPADASMLLGIWAEYGSRNETSSYLAKSFELNPYNAIKLLKCYLPPAQPGGEPPTAEDFTMTQYKNVAGVVDPDIVYAALSKIFKFDISTIEEKVPIAPEDRNLAFQFMRLHHEVKGQS